MECKSQQERSESPDDVISVRDKNELVVERILRGLGIGPAERPCSNIQS